MSYPSRRPPRSSGFQKWLSKWGPPLVLVVIVIVLWKTGTFITIRNWINSLYGEGSSAVTQSQQAFQSGIAQDRQRQENRGMGIKNPTR